MPSTATRCSFSRIACQIAAGRRVDRPAHDHEDGDQVAERDPVEVLRVEDADHPARQVVEVDADALLRHRSSWRGFFWTSVEPASAKASVTIANAIPLTRRLTAPSTSGSSRPTSATKSERRRQAPAPFRRRDRGQVDADRDVERVPEGQQARVAEEQVVGERDPAEAEHQAEQLQRPGLSSGDVKTPCVSSEIFGMSASTPKTTTGMTMRAVALQCVGLHLPNRPPGRISSVTASSRTTERSPMPDDL